MNGLPLRSLTPDADAPLLMPRSASYCELGIRGRGERSRGDLDTRCKAGHTLGNILLATCTAYTKQRGTI